LQAAVVLLRKTEVTQVLALSPVQVAVRAVLVLAYLILLLQVKMAVVAVLLPITTQAQQVLVFLVKALQAAQPQTVAALAAFTRAAEEAAQAQSVAMLHQLVLKARTSVALV
jgi:hypothetical protein